jgi:thiamine biosynthesis lipoprotein
MKQTRLIMGMPISIEIISDTNPQFDIDEAFAYFTYVDKKFSIYKKNSEISKINRGKLADADYSTDMKWILENCELTKQQTDGYFDVNHKNKLDPSGLVKGWSIYNVAQLLKQKGHENFYVDAGGDIQVSGKNAEGKDWIVGIRNPFNRDENVKILKIDGKGIATSGTYIRGQHVYNPKNASPLNEIVSLTVIGPNVYDADRFATAAFAMQKAGVYFIEKLEGYEAYQIDKDGIALFTSNFNEYVAK